MTGEPTIVQILRRPLYLLPVLTLAVMFILPGCSKKKPPDPVATVKAMMPVIQDALNHRDLATLKKMGTERFEANRFVTDVFSHGVEGDVTLSLMRIRHVTGEVRLHTRGRFGDKGAGGIKNIIIFFTGEKWKIDTYSITDEKIPDPTDRLFDSTAGQTGPSDPS